MKRVVVTGGSGRVGKYVVAQLMRENQVVVADLKPSDHDVEYVETDVMDLDAVRRAVENADAVIHLAAIDFDWKAPEEQYINVNVRGTWHVLQACRDAGVKKVILCSSISACGLSEMRKDWAPQSLPVDELHENKPYQAYSISKIVMEQMAKSFADATDMEVICLRPLAVVLPETIEDYIKFVDNPNRYWLFYYIWAEDLAHAFEAAVDIEGLKFGVFFISADDTSHPEDTFNWYQKVIGDLPTINNPLAYKNNPRASIFSSDKAKNILGWKPTTDFNELRKKYAK
ncbi:NAD(P)-dependent oxidoreductase [Oligella urethralis]|uniref:NAD-dependent epimerase/dehydratase family protein n=1 Tax=Oligella urethralis TaxID=90245 RepID=UPI000D008014|nr:NAD(P)-dependent oxidoreductase [Oligella urethralis]AVL71410.1 NAD(P)-dependent oxidoreductase [Oligella urethralis]